MLYINLVQNNNTTFATGKLQIKMCKSIQKTLLHLFLHTCLYEYAYNRIQMLSCEPHSSQPDICVEQFNYEIWVAVYFYSVQCH